MSTTAYLKDHVLTQQVSSNELITDAVGKCGVQCAAAKLLIGHHVDHLHLPVRELTNQNSVAVSIILTIEKLTCQ